MLYSQPASYQGVQTARAQNHHMNSFHVHTFLLAYAALFRLLLTDYHRMGSHVASLLSITAPSAWRHLLGGYQSFHVCHSLTAQYNRH